jgi:hypothetical protein
LRSIVQRLQDMQRRCETGGLQRKMGNPPSSRLPGSTMNDA